MLYTSPKGHRLPAFIMSHCIWFYHRFSLSYRDIEELMVARGIHLSYESIRRWCQKFARHLTKALRKKEAVRGEKWHSRIYGFFSTMQEMEIRKSYAG